MKTIFNKAKTGLKTGLYGLGTVLGIVVIVLGVYSALLGSVSGVYASQLAGTVVFLLAVGGIAAYVLTRETATTDYDLLKEVADFLEIPHEQRALDAYKDYAKAVGRFKSQHLNPALKARAFTRDIRTPMTADKPLKSVKRWIWVGDKPKLTNWDKANWSLVEKTATDYDVATHINLSTEISEQVFITSENRAFYTDASGPAPYSVELHCTAALRADLIGVARARLAWLHEQRLAQETAEIDVNPNKMAPVTPVTF